MASTSTAAPTYDQPLKGGQRDSVDETLAAQPTRHDPFVSPSSSHQWEPLVSDRVCWSLLCIDTQDGRCAARQEGWHSAVVRYGELSFSAFETVVFVVRWWL